MVISSPKPLISVIIPTYNRSHLIMGAIESAIAQSYQNLEIIIVDDASTDKTEELIATVKDSRLRYIRHQTNLGGANARNTGIDAAQGEYIAFLDSDDVWLPHKIELQLSTLQNYPNSDKVVSYTQFQPHKAIDGLSVIPQRGKQETETVADYLWVHGGEIITSTLMLPRSLAVVTHFRPGLKKHQDLDFYLRLEANKAQFYLLEQPLTLWHNEPRSDRISKLSHYQSSLDWIQEYTGLISNKAIHGFLVKEVVPKLLLSQEKRRYTAKLLFDAFREGVLPSERFLLLMSKLILPRDSYLQLITIIKTTVRLN
jgi:glycosyltransferase involved in cell wall biosynthesis